ncbi:MAG: glycosyl hydrolase 53 family protein [Actinomycetota bacterium]|nr:glycosyl hydrolase 53 family protein [Actinomycetota bacterium]
MTRSDSNVAPTRNGPRPRRRRHLSGPAAAGAAALVALFASPVAAQLQAPATAHHGALQSDAQAPTIDWALSGQATAEASQSANPPSNAIDGDAATSWCTASWPDTLTVDLGQVRQLDGIGITLDNSSSSARASLSIATAAGQWQPVATAQSIALDPGNPMYVPLAPAGTSGGLPGQSAGTITPGGPTGGASPGVVPVRYAELTVWDSGSAPVCVGEFRLLGPGPAAAGMMLGADMSFTAQELAAGNTFSDAGVTANPISILADHGAGWARLRLWVNPPSGYSDLATDLALAKTIKQAGLKLFLDIHYSDFWADPGKQCIPAGWPDTFPALPEKVQSYTQQVVSAFAAQGTPVDMVSIGNEVTNGMLWSYDSAAAGNWVDFGCKGTPGQGGYLDWSGNTSATGWANFTQLLKAGIAGAQTANPPGHKLLIAIHTDLGGGETPYGANDTEKSQYFYSQLEAYGVPFNVIALSYYPEYQGSLSGMRATVDNLATTIKKPIVIAETQYAWTLANGDALGNDTWQPSNLTDGYPANPGGQISFINDELSILAAAPNGLGAGLFWWEPEWIPGVSWAPNASPPGTPDDNMTLFDFQGRALPSITIFQDPVSTCTSYDPYEVPCVIP